MVNYMTFFEVMDLMVDLLVAVDMDKMMEMILQPLFVAHLRFLQARASPMTTTFLEME